MQKKSNTRSHKCKTHAQRVAAIDRQIRAQEAKDILDIALAGERTRIEAEATYDMIQVCGPDFIAKALMDAIDAAAESKNLPVPMFSEDEDESREQAIKKIADIFTIARDFEPYTPNTTAALAQDISAILNNPETPSNLYNAISDELTEWQEARNNDSEQGWTTPGFIADTLTAYQRKEEQTKGDAR